LTAAFQCRSPSLIISPSSKTRAPAGGGAIVCSASLMGPVYSIIGREKAERGTRKGLRAIGRQFPVTERFRIQINRRRGASRAAHCCIRFCFLCSRPVRDQADNKASKSDSAELNHCY